MLQQLTLRLLLLLGIGANIGFLLINLRPERPHLGTRQHVKVLLRADPPRAKWIKENQLDEFAAAHDVEMEVVTAATFEDVMTMLKAEAQHPSGLVLASINDQIAAEVQKAGTVRPMHEFLEKKELDAALREYLPSAVARCRGSDGKIWYLPRRAEMDIAVYLRPAVEDAYLHWTEDRAAIQKALAEANGVGLPRDYAMEKTPDAWDSYDLFVAAWYWAHHRAPWAQPSFAAPGADPGPLTRPAPRVAFRTGPNEDAINDLLNAFYRHGLLDAQIGQLDAPAVLDALQWRVLYRKHHLMPPECEDSKGIDSDGVNDLFKQGRLAWAPINQEDSLWLHGGARRDAAAGMAGSSDLDWATLPAGASLELKEGVPARSGRSFSMQGVHLWAVPVYSPHPRLAFALAHFLTQRGPQQRETEAQGLLPIRQDLRAEYPILFRLEWMQRILDASYRQMDRGTGSVPAAVASLGYDDRYADLFARVVNQATGIGGTLQAIRAAVTEVPHGQ